MEHYKTMAIANYFIEKSKYNINPMKLEILMYYAHSWSLVELDAPLLDCDILKSEYGIRINDVYNNFKYYGNNNISNKFNYIGDNQLITPSIKYEFIKEGQESQKLKFLDDIIEHYGKSSAITLSNMMYLSKTPWSTTKSKIISNKTIKDYFLELKNNNKVNSNLTELEFNDLKKITIKKIDTFLESCPKNITFSNVYKIGLKFIKENVDTSKINEATWNFEGRVRARSGVDENKVNHRNVLICFMVDKMNGINKTLISLEENTLDHINYNEIKGFDNEYRTPIIEEESLDFDKEYGMGF